MMRAMKFFFVTGDGILKRTISDADSCWNDPVSCLTDGKDAEVFCGSAYTATPFIPSQFQRIVRCGLPRRKVPAPARQRRFPAIKNDQNFSKICIQNELK